MPVALEPPFILLAEDNQADVYLVRKSLEEHGVGHELRTVKDGEDALRLIAEMGSGIRCPELVLLDLNLPKVGGSEVLERLRENPECAHVPVIVLTSSDSPDDRGDTVRLGARAYFRKPMQLDAFLQLGELVRRILGEASNAP